MKLISPKFLLAAFFIFSVYKTCQAQLYKVKASWPMVFYAEIKNDSVHLEGFEVYPYWSVFSIIDDTLLISSVKENHNNSGQKFEIKKRKNKYYVIYPKGNKIKTRKLKVAEADDRNNLRKTAYSTKKAIYIRRFGDSIAPSVNLLRHSLYLLNHDLSYDEHVRQVNTIADSLVTAIMMAKDTSAAYYYKKTTNIKSLDTSEIFNLLANANYDYAYSKYLTEQLALHKPETLIDYVAKDPLNKKLLLRQIRWHEKYKEIVSHIQQVPEESTAKKLIVKQKTKHKREDIAAATLYFGIITAEITALVLLTIWIF